MVQKCETNVLKVKKEFVHYPFLSSPNFLELLYSFSNLAHSFLDYVYSFILHAIKAEPCVLLGKEKNHYVCNNTYRNCIVNPFSLSENKAPGN